MNKSFAAGLEESRFMACFIALFEKFNSKHFVIPMSSSFASRFEPPRFMESFYALMSNNFSARLEKFSFKASLTEKCCAERLVVLLNSSFAARLEEPMLI